jgi:hypothetical protein
MFLGRLNRLQKEAHMPDEIPFVAIAESAKVIENQ